MLKSFKCLLRLSVSVGLVFAAQTVSADTTIPAIVANGQGQVGIGTSSPTAQLDVKGNALVQGLDGSAATSLTVVSPSLPTVFSGEAMRVKLPGSQGDFNYLTLTPKSPEANYVSWSFGLHSFWGGNNHILTFDPRGNGRIGINTDSPQAALDIQSKATNNILTMRNSEGAYAVWNVRGSTDPNLEVTVYNTSNQAQFTATLSKSGWKVS